jgi:predicted RNA methylase
MKLTKQQTARHEDAEALLRQDKLRLDERQFVMEHWNPAACHNIGVNGVFFTPLDMARDAVMFGQSDNTRVLDACAGIGRLAWNVIHTHGCTSRVTCVEINPTFVAVGRKVLPEAEWICGCVFDVLPTLPPFDVAFSNPPYGRVPSVPAVKPFRSAQFAVIDLLVRHTRRGAILIIPDTDHSQENKRNGERATPSSDYLKFIEKYPQAGIAPTSTDRMGYTRFSDTGTQPMICDLWFEGGLNPYLATATATAPETETATPAPEVALEPQLSLF